MVLLYVTVGVVGNDNAGWNFEFSGETWLEAWAKVNAWMQEHRKEDRWYRIWA
jgi:hypothetical protein